MFLKFDGHMANDKFISIMVLSFFRPEMTLELLKSIHANADMPFEIILHDDHSDAWVQSKIYKEMRGLCSTVILGQGDINMGYSASANRGTALCNSDYVLLLNNDCLITKPCFKMIKSVLDVPYIATMSPKEVRGMVGGSVDPNRAIASNGEYAFSLAQISRGSDAFAYKKSTWYEHGGFPQVYNNGGDISFIFSLTRRGYFHAGWIVDPDEKSDQPIRNIDWENDYSNATAGIRPFDESYPRIFPYCHQGAAYQAESHRRRERRYPLSQEQYLSPAGHHNIDYWSKWADNSHDGQGNIVWENVKEWSHDKWQKEVEADIKTWKALGE